MRKTWFITGASRGFGRICAEAALECGDQVTATTRTLADVADLKQRFGDRVLSLVLDVTNSDQVQHVVEQAHAHFGRLDVLVNSAGTSPFAATEEASDEQIRGLFDANYFGMVRVLRAALPLLRQKRSGHILGVSSGLGITALPMIGFYCATKWAVEALHEALAQEVKAFGIHVTLVEPGAYATDFGRSHGSPKFWNHTRILGSSFSRGWRAWNAATLTQQPGRFSSLWTRIIRRCGWGWATRSCRVRAPHMLSAWPHGKRGRTSRMQPWVNRRNR